MGTANYEGLIDHKRGCGDKLWQRFIFLDKRVYLLLDIWVNGRELKVVGK